MALQAARLISRNRKSHFDKAKGLGFISQYLPVAWVMFLTAKQYSPIRGRTRISCYVLFGYLPLPPSPLGDTCEFVFSMCVWVTVGCYRGACRPTLSCLIIATVCLRLCGEIDGIQLLWASPSPGPFPVGLLLPNQALSDASSLKCVFTDTFTCWSVSFSHSQLADCKTAARP